jgi:hypothetical protein
MVKLLRGDIREYEAKSSKGNQLKWYSDGIWYKADYTGYEGLSEYVVSELLKHSTLDNEEFVKYDTEEIQYEYITYNGCKSRNFLPNGWELITLERLFKMSYQKSLNKAIYSIDGYEKRAEFLVEQVERITGIPDFGEYISKLMTVDAMFLNEDRHTHNIAVLRDENGKYHKCPIFDNGASLLADTMMDYPLGAPLNKLMDKVQPKTFSNDFDIQLDTVEKLYGQKIKFNFDHREVENILAREPFYLKEIKDRIYEIIMNQRRKYRYLFS